MQTNSHVMILIINTSFARVVSLNNVQNSTNYESISRNTVSIKVRIILTRIKMDKAQHVSTLGSNFSTNAAEYISTKSSILLTSHKTRFRNGVV